MQEASWPINQRVCLEAKKLRNRFLTLWFNFVISNFVISNFVIPNFVTLKIAISNFVITTCDPPLCDFLIPNFVVLHLSFNFLNLWFQICDPDFVIPSFVLHFAFLKFYFSAFRSLCPNVIPNFMVSNQLVISILWFLTLWLRTGLSQVIPTWCLILWFLTLWFFDPTSNFLTSSKLHDSQQRGVMEA